MTSSSTSLSFGTHTAWVKIAGKPVKVHDVGIDDSENKRSGYIESSDGAAFTIHVNYSTRGESGSTFRIDGRNLEVSKKRKNKEIAIDSDSKVEADSSDSYSSDSDDATFDTLQQALIGLTTLVATLAKAKSKSRRKNEKSLRKLKKLK